MEAVMLIEQLGWHPRTGFEDLVKLMVDADLEEVAAAKPRLRV